MYDLSGYKKVDYSELKKSIDNRIKRSEKNLKSLSGVIGVTTASIRSIHLNEYQAISDKLITLVIDILGIDALIVWEKGQRLYFMK